MVQVFIFLIKLVFVVSIFFPGNGADAAKMATVLKKTVAVLAVVINLSEKPHS